MKWDEVVENIIIKGNGITNILKINICIVLEVFSIWKESLFWILIQFKISIIQYLYV